MAPTGRLELTLLSLLLVEIMSCLGPSSDKENNGKANQRTCGKNKNNVQQSDSLALNSHRLELFQKSYQGVQMSPDDRQLFNKVLDHKLGLKGAVDSDHVKTVMKELGGWYYSHEDTRLRIPLGKVPVSELNPIVDADDVLNPYLAQLTDTVRLFVDRDESLRAMFDPDVKVKEQWVRGDEDHVYLFITCGTGCVHEALHRSFARNMEHSIRDNGLEHSVVISSGSTRTSKKEPDAAVAVMQGPSRGKRNVVFEGAHHNENLEQLLQEASEAFISNDRLNYFVGAKFFDETKRAKTGREPSMFAMVVERKKRKRDEIDDSSDMYDEKAKENYKKFKEDHSAEEDVDIGSIVFAAHMGRGEILNLKREELKAIEIPLIETLRQNHKTKVVEMKGVPLVMDTSLVEVSPSFENQRARFTPDDDRKLTYDLDPALVFRGAPTVDDNMDSIIGIHVNSSGLAHAPQIKFGDMFVKAISFWYQEREDDR